MTQKVNNESNVSIFVIPDEVIEKFTSAGQIAGTIEVFDKDNIRVGSMALQIDLVFNEFGSLFTILWIAVVVNIILAVTVIFLWPLIKNCYKLERKTKRVKDVNIKGHSNEEYDLDQ